jgi:hypothetical protein
LREIDKMELDVLLVDTLRSFTGIPDESDAAKVGEAMLPLGLLARRKHLSAIATHHLRKSEGDGGLAHSGNTAFVALADVAAELRLDKSHAPNRRVLTTVSRFDETPKALTIELKDGNIVALGAPEAVGLTEVTARVWNLLVTTSEGMTIREVSVALDDPKPSAEQIRRAVESLGSKLVKGGEGKRGSPFVYRAKDSFLLRTPSRVGETNPEAFAP